MQGIKVNHRREKHVIPRLLLEKTVDVVLHCDKVSATSAMHVSLFASVCKSQLNSACKHRNSPDAASKPYWQTSVLFVLRRKYKVEPISAALRR